MCAKFGLRNISLNSHQLNGKNILSQSIDNVRTKLFEFQFKIIHRVFPTYSYVSNFYNTVRKICNLCHVENNIPHMFVDCVKVNQFWQSCKVWLAGIEGNAINLSTSKIIFGIQSGSKLYINFCILHAK